MTLALAIVTIVLIDYTKYDIWNDGIALPIRVYEETKRFPTEDNFGLISQIKRSSLSISSNFAEGCSRSSENDFKRFLEIALGSAFERKTQLIISEKLGYLNSQSLEDLVKQLDKVSKQINSLRNKLK